MSHERGPAVSGDGKTPETPEKRFLRRLRRHLLEWSRRYVEMRVGAIENKSN
ncbi:hypothetical protein [Halobellus rarus]|uniref:Uncharacterized protein n=1 Tax=Halobellus rarus TaxID=1126237 RepID=A0ABD6CJZ8_9EURY|nr:hypothetical protein [Halobellus rarus]